MGEIQDGAPWTKKGVSREYITLTIILASRRAGKVQARLESSRTAQHARLFQNGHARRNRPDIAGFQEVVESSRSAHALYAIPSAKPGLLAA